MAATRIILSTTIPLALILVLLAVYLVLRTRYNARRRRESLEAGGYGEEGEPEELLRFSGGEHLTAHDILDAPGEVVGKSGYGTLYRAAVQRGGAALLLLRFVRPRAPAGPRRSCRRSELLKQSNQSATSEECLLMYFQVAMACCSPSPALRPDIKQVIRKLEEIEDDNGFAAN
ncbi:hypothetical protein J5N97_029734 [Dioscorea zingiberensis]|uniref:Uncharacterized protein n=1 Tax=Dioscorea zingiberensis TaxID=325984 RepID=A0A9D5H3M1_9LILI|nr:hypothetical protein J5N97_029734 [Dioscorea zingiberensis]